MHHGMGGIAHINGNDVGGTFLQRDAFGQPNITVVIGTGVNDKQVTVRTHTVALVLIGR